MTMTGSAVLPIPGIACKARYFAGKTGEAVLADDSGLCEARSGSGRGAVTVLVSHRFSTVRGADLILVMDDGRVTDLGSHDELLLRQGLYAELYLLQARAYA